MLETVAGAIRGKDEIGLAPASYRRILRRMRLAEEDLARFTAAERELLFGFRQNCPEAFSSERDIDGRPHCVVVDRRGADFAEFFLDGALIVAVLGGVTHTHPGDLSELWELLARILADKIVAWRVTEPEGWSYAGFYDIDLYHAAPEETDHPFGAPAGSVLSRSSFGRIAGEETLL